VLMDFDQWVVDLHRIYGVFFKHAETPEAFLALWSRRQRAVARRLVRDALRDVSRKHKIGYVFLRTRSKVDARLQLIAKRYRRLGIATFLTDQKQYDYLRQLVLSGRVIAKRGNLMGKKTMRLLGETAKRLGLVVRTFYLSNAEEYISRAGRPMFRANVMGLPMDERSLTLRTLPWRHGSKRYWTYYIQRLDNFSLWLRYHKRMHVRKMVGKDTGKPRALVVVTKLPPAYLKSQSRPQL